MTEAVVENKIKRLLKRLGVQSDGVLVVHEMGMLSSMETKSIFDALLPYSHEGTLAILGDLSFNTHVNVMDEVPNFSTQQRMVLASGKLLQLLILEDDVTFAKHPAHMIAQKGKFAKFFARQTKLDFPYGERSLFEDWYDLNTMLVFVGEMKEIPELKYLISKLHKPVVNINSSVKDREVVEYLDYDIDTQHLTKLVFGSNLLLYETIGDTNVYGIGFKQLEEFVKQHFESAEI